MPWLIAVTRRDAGAGFHAPDRPAVVRIEPAPLAPEAALALAEAATEAAPLPPHLIAEVAVRSGGNPQFLSDLLRDAHAPGEGSLPESIEAAATARIDRLSTADRAVVRHAAVLGVAFDPADAAELLADAGPPPDAATWARLHRYFEADGERHLRFRRAVVRDVAYAGLPFSRRRALHARAAGMLERRLGDRAADAAAALSLHFLLGGDPERAWHYAREAGDRARERFAHADAARLYRRALDAAAALEASGAGPSRTLLAATWEALGDAHASTGEPAAAQAAFSAARRIVAGDAVQEAHLLHRQALVEERGGRTRSAVRWVGRGLRALEPVEGAAAGAVRAQLIGTLAAARQRQGRTAEAIALCRRAIAEAEAAGDDAALARACYVLDWALVESGRDAEATYSARALDIYERLGDLVQQAAVLNNLGGFAYESGRWDEAVDYYTRSAQTNVRAGDLVDAAFGDCNVGEVLADQGHLAEAEVRLRRAIKVWRGMGDDHGVAFGMLLLGRTAVRAGRPAEGLEMLEEALAQLRALRAQGDATLAEALLAEAWAFERRPTRALDGVRHLERDLPETARHAPLVHCVRGYALAQLGHPAAARAAFDAATAAARAAGRDYDLAVALHAIVALKWGDVPISLRRERDAVLLRLRVAQLPDPPLGAAPAAGRPAAAVLERTA
jgi:tetratricopeptide (TPR) repeat protein